jgi:hypothetical protein
MRPTLFTVDLVPAENPIRAGQTVCTVLAWSERVRGWPRQPAGWAYVTGHDGEVLLRLA